MIEGFNCLMLGGVLLCFDVIIVVWGGGSIEDFWGFNEEIVVWIVVVFDILLIFVVGYEIDIILIDFIFDWWVLMFIVVVEMVVFVWLELLNWVES